MTFEDVSKSIAFAQYAQPWSLLFRSGAVRTEPCESASVSPSVSANLRCYEPGAPSDGLVLAINLGESSLVRSH